MVMFHSFLMFFVCLPEGTWVSANGVHPLEFSIGKMWENDD